MAFSRKCRRALQKKRAGHKTKLQHYHACVDAGEASYINSTPCPYTDANDIEAWREGYQLASDDTAR